MRGVVSESQDPRQARRQEVTASCPEAPRGRKNPDKTAGSSRNGSRGGGCWHQEGFQDLPGQGAGARSCHRAVGHSRDSRPGPRELSPPLPYLLPVLAPATVQQDPGLR